MESPTTNGRERKANAQEMGIDKVRLTRVIPRRHNDLTRSCLNSIWVPIKGPVRGSPLAVCDYQTVCRDDLVAVDSVFPHRVMEVYHVKHNPSHQWYYMEDQNVDDLLILKSWDSQEDKACCRRIPQTYRSTSDVSD